MNKITERNTVFSTPWFDVRAKVISGNDQAVPYYSLRLPDYVSIVALTMGGDILLVRQYRPAIEKYTLELPSGHVEPDQTPEASARGELLEETGYQAEQMELLGILAPDTGRLENRLWCYFAADVKPPMADFQPEPGVEVVACQLQELPDLIASARLDNALNLGVLMLAIIKYGPELIAKRR